MRLRVHYERPEELLADAAAQFSRGGVLVRAAIPAGLALFDEVELEVSTAFAGGVVVRGQVVQLVSEAGIAVTFDPRATEPLIAAAREALMPAPGTVAAPPGGSAASPGSSAASPGSSAASPGSSAASLAEEPPVPSQRQSGDFAARIQAALHGNKDERWRIIRDVNKMLHPYVLKNIGIGLDEVLAIAKLTTVAPDLLSMIADRREWAQRPEIASALVRNPKTPVPAAIRLLDNIAPAELRQLAKDTHTRPAIQQAARKKVLG